MIHHSARRALTTLAAGKAACALSLASALPALAEDERAALPTLQAAAPEILVEFSWTMEGA